jgi:predicted nucleic-acid-binding protein
MEVAIVDANVFLRFLLKDNPGLFKQASSILTKAKEGKIQLLVPSIVIFEISFVLGSVYKFTKEKIIQNIESLLSVKYLSIDELTILKQAVTLYKTSSNSLVDCFLLEKANSQGIKLLTFDKKLSKLST